MHAIEWVMLHSTCCCPCAVKGEARRDWIRRVQVFRTAVCIAGADFTLVECIALSIVQLEHLISHAAIREYRDWVWADQIFLL